MSVSLQRGKVVTMVAGVRDAYLEEVGGGGMLADEERMFLSYGRPAMAGFAIPGDSEVLVL